MPFVKETDKQSFARTRTRTHTQIYYIVNKHSKGKGKAIPLQAWTGPEGSRRLRLPDFKTISTQRW